MDLALGNSEGSHAFHEVDELNLLPYLPYVAIPLRLLDNARMGMVLGIQRWEHESIHNLEDRH